MIAALRNAFIHVNVAVIEWSSKKIDYFETCSCTHIMVRKTLLLMVQLRNVGFI